MRPHNPLIIIIAWMFFTLALVSSVNAYEFPPYQGIKLKIIGDISESYSNNITFASDDENKIEDFRTMLNIGLDLKYEGKKRSIDFSGRARRQIFEGTSNVRNPSENISLTFNNEFSEYDRIILRGTIEHTQEPGVVRGDFDINACRDYFRDSGFSAIDIEAKCNEFKAEFDRFKGRFDSYNYSYYITYIRDFSESFNISTYYSYGMDRSTAEGTNDSQQNSLRIQGNYNYSETASLFLAYGYQVSNFEEGEKISRQSYNFGIGQYITKLIYLTGSIGKTTVSSGNDSILVQAMLRSELDEITEASLSYSQGTEISSFQRDTYKNWQITANLTRLLSEDLHSTLSAFYGKGDYSSSDITDTLIGANFYLSYNFWRSKRGSEINGNFGYSYSNLDSDDRSRGYTRNSINSGITLAF